MRFFGFGGGAAPSELEAELRRVTEVNLIDVPSKESMITIVQATHNPNDRREIMRHLNDCLAEPSGARWRRIHGGLVLLEQLLQKGARELITETAEGQHFDLVQRLTFLERFDFLDDQRVQKMVRQKAGVLRSELIALTQGDEISNDDIGNMQGFPAKPGMRAAPVSMASEKSFSSESYALAKLAAESQDDKYAGAPGRPPAKPVLVSGIVSAGHRDDTDSESESEEADDRHRPAPQRHEGQRDNSSAVPDSIDLLDAGGGGCGAYNGAGDRRDRQPDRNNSNVVAKKTNFLEDSTDSDVSSDSRHQKKGSYRGGTPAPQPAPVHAAAEANLLDFGGTPASQPAPVHAAAESSLLDF